jgi:putative membrane protein
MADPEAPAETAVGTGDEAAVLPWWLSVYLKGAAMGAADTVPGVSGGTIALIVGVYERLVTAITELDPMAVLLLGDIHTSDGRAALLARLREMEVPFLLALGGGVLTAVVTLSRLLEVALAEFPAPTFAFFFGLIGASAVVLYGEVDIATPRRAAVAVAGIVAAFLLTGPIAAALPSTLPVVFLAGAIAISAMVLPGVSGSFLLLVLGQYEFMVGTLGTFVDAVFAVVTGGARADLAAPGSVVLTFCAGAAVGLLTVAHVIRWALDHYRAATLTLLVSLMVGALRLPAREVAENVGQPTPAVVGGLLAAGLAGAVLVLGLDHITADLGL